jgi:hypothetical protein
MLPVANLLLHLRKVPSNDYSRSLSHRSFTFALFLIALDVTDRVRVHISHGRRDPGLTFGRKEALAEINKLANPLCICLLHFRHCSPSE